MPLIRARFGRRKPPTAKSEEAVQTVAEVQPEETTPTKENAPAPPPFSPSSPTKKAIGGGGFGSNGHQQQPPHASPRSSSWVRVAGALLVGGLVLAGAAWWWIFPHAKHLDLRKTMLTPGRLHAHCTEHIGAPRVLEVTPGVFVAIGYDLANTILIQTPAGHVVVDVSMNPSRATLVRKDLEAAAGKAPIHTIIYTHSHVDHVGGAEVWAENGTQIWGTDALTPHFFKQYGSFRKAEALRGARQFGNNVPLSELPCSGLGARADIDLTARTMAFVIPTHTFSGQASLEVGGVQLELVEAHGETHDMLFVWLPQQQALLCGDNYYESFPNMYSIRGTSPRPIRDWIRSLDAMRKLEPEYLIPSHTQPLVGRALINKQLTDYRDGIQWVYAATVRGANDGKTLDDLAEHIALPPHLRAQSALDELYGQIDWSVRAIYTNELGWFDGASEGLYRLPVVEQSHRLVEQMGGPLPTMQQAEAALAQATEPEYRWCLYLLQLLKDSGSVGHGKDKVAEARAVNVEIKALRGLGALTVNSNGRGYLLQRAFELEDKAYLSDPILGTAFIESIPIATIMDVMVTRLIPERSVDSHVAAIYNIGGTKYWITVRHGVVEITQGDVPLPGTPEPVGEFTVSESAFRRIVLKQLSPVTAVATGEATIAGDLVAFVQMTLMFEQGA